VALADILATHGLLVERKLTYYAVTLPVGGPPYNTATGWPAYTAGVDITDHLGTWAMTAGNRYAAGEITLELDPNVPTITPGDVIKMEERYTSADEVGEWITHGHWTLAGQDEGSTGPLSTVGYEAPYILTTDLFIGELKGDLIEVTKKELTKIIDPTTDGGEVYVFVDGTSGTHTWNWANTPSAAQLWADEISFYDKEGACQVVYGDGEVHIERNYFEATEDDGGLETPTAVYAAYWRYVVTGDLVTATVTAADATTITCGASSWTPNEFVNQRCIVTSGDGKGHVFIVASNTATVLTIAGEDPTDYGLAATNTLQLRDANQAEDRLRDVLHDAGFQSKANTLPYWIEEIELGSNNIYLGPVEYTSDGPKQHLEIVKEIIDAVKPNVEIWADVDGHLHIAEVVQGKVTTLSGNEATGQTVLSVVNEAIFTVGEHAYIWDTAHTAYEDLGDVTDKSAINHTVTVTTGLAADYVTGDELSTTAVKYELTTWENCTEVSDPGGIATEVIYRGRAPRVENRAWRASGGKIIPIKHWDYEWGAGTHHLQLKNNGSTVDTVSCPHTHLDGDEAAGQTILSVAATSSFVVGNRVRIWNTARTACEELGKVTDLAAGATITVTTALIGSYSNGDEVENVEAEYAAYEAAIDNDMHKWFRWELDATLTKTADIFANEDLFTIDLGAQYTLDMVQVQCGKNPNDTRGLRIGILASADNTRWEWLSNDLNFAEYWESQRILDIPGVTARYIKVRCMQSAAKTNHREVSIGEVFVFCTDVIEQTAQAGVDRSALTPVGDDFTSAYYTGLKQKLGRRRYIKPDTGVDENARHATDPDQYVQDRADEWLKALARYYSTLQVTGIRPDAKLNDTVQVTITDRGIDALYLIRTLDKGPGGSIRAELVSYA
jgi:hypothetical protein